MATKKGFTETLQAEKEAAAAAFMSQTGTDQPEGEVRTAEPDYHTVK